MELCQKHGNDGQITEVNKILEAKGYKFRENGVWRISELGKSFGIEVEN